MKAMIDETELARLEELAKDATPTPWMGTIDPSHFYTFSTILGGEKKQSRGLNHQLIVQVGGWATVREQQANTRYIAAACNNAPALVAEVRRLREALNKEHRAWQCADARGDWLEMENAALREKVEAWKWFEECFEVTQWLMANGQATPESRFIDVLSNNARVESLISTNFARERAVHADRE